MICLVMSQGATTLRAATRRTAASRTSILTDVMVNARCILGRSLLLGLLHHRAGASGIALIVESGIVYIGRAADGAGAGRAAAAAGTIVGADIVLHAGRRCSCRSIAINISRWSDSRRSIIRRLLCRCRLLFTVRAGERKSEDHSKDDSCTKFHVRLLS